MAQRNDHSVPASAAGILFQFQRALVHLAQSTGGCVGIETTDDVTVLRPDGTQIWEQDKLSFKLSGVPVTDRSENLWKTWSIWLENLRTFPADASDVELYLVTNKKVNGGLASEVSAATTSPAAKSCIKKMRSISSKDEDVQKYIDQVLSYSDQQIADMILRIKLCDGGISTTPSSLPEAMKQELRCPTWVNAAVVADALLGWLATSVAAAWEKHIPAWITSSAFNDQKHCLIDDMRSNKARERPAVELLVTTSERAAQRFRHFVEHLASIDASEEDIEEAIESFIQFDSERSRLLINGEVTPKQWSAFFDSLARRWKPIFRRHRRDAVTTKLPEEVGMCIYFDTCQTDHRAHLAGEKTRESYMTCGAYQSLADGDEVWWHPDYETQPKGSK